MNGSSSPLLTVDEARALRASGGWQEIVTRSAGIPAEALFAEPELAFLVAVGYRRTGDAARALELLARVEPEARRRGERRLLLEVINLAGNALFESGRMTDAEARYAELLEASTAWSDEEGKARAANNLGAVANVRGRRDLALTCYQRALASYQRLGDVRGLAETHHNLAISYRDLGFDRDADAHFGRAVELSEGAGLEDVIALAEAERAELRVRWRDGRLAGEMARRALERFRRIADPIGVAQSLRILGLAALAEGDAGEADARLNEALEVARSLDDALLRAEVQRDRGLLLRDLGDAAAAGEALADAEAHFRQVGALAEAEALKAMAAALAEDMEEAEALSPPS